MTIDEDEMKLESSMDTFIIPQTAADANKSIGKMSSSKLLTNVIRFAKIIA